MANPADCLSREYIRELLDDEHPWPTWCADHFRLSLNEPSLRKFPFGLLTNTLRGIRQQANDDRAV